MIGLNENSSSIVINIMEAVLEILKQPFIWGLLVGLLIAFFMWKSGYTAAQHLKKEAKRVNEEMKELQNHLNTQLKINATGNEKLTQELDALKEQNENLRVNIASIQQKPDKAELKHLQVTEKAVSLMREQAPGFATAWEKALREAEEEYANAENGLSKLVKKVIPRLGKSTEKEAPKAIEAESAES